MYYFFEYKMWAINTLRNYERKHSIMMRNSIEYGVEKGSLVAHSEGGFYRETYRSKGKFMAEYS